VGAVGGAIARGTDRLGALGVDVAAVSRAASAVAGSLAAGGKLLIFGNGGSAADAQHLAAEFVGRFVADRRPLSAVALTTDSSALTAIGNDYGFDQIFARQVVALGRHGDVALAISTSGTSENVLRAVEAARAIGVCTIGLTGARSRLSEAVNIAITTPAPTIAEVQEAQLAVEHTLCYLVEQACRAPVIWDGGSRRVVDERELVALREQWRQLGLIVVWTNGCFDLLHVGHLSSLERARRLGDILVVGLNSDRSVRVLKGAGRPLTPELERAELMAGLRSVDWVTVFDDLTPERILSVIRPDVHCKSEEYGEAGRPMPERAVVEMYGGRVVLLPSVEGRSTTRIVDRASNVPG
jgi:rfaE bifunctional protein nucleotidyltransferase chain/domain